jgi:hypothetical protein
MKMKKEHYEYMREAIQAIETKFPEAKKQYFEAGLSAKRYRWDVLYAAKLSAWVCDNLYSYLDDSHIDTALRHIISDHGNASIITIPEVEPE